MARSGLTAVASLDGGPVDRDDAIALGLEGANDAMRLDGAILRTRDGEVPTAEGYAQSGSLTLAFLGETRGADELATALGVPGADSATLAMRVVEHWGDERGTHLPGEWSLMQWDESRRELIVAASPARRDQVFVAHGGGRVAIAPSISELADLPWVGRTLDDAGLARGLAVRPLRNADPHATMLAAVTRLPPGQMLRIDAAGCRRVEPIAEPAPTRWEGSFEEAVAALEAALRDEVRAAMAPHRAVAVMLSGGLDSSLLACIVAEERRADQDVILLCSVAPDGSGLPDERRYAAMVAESCGLPLKLVVPDPDADVFEPQWHSLEAGGPSMASMHYVSAALCRTAEAHGATLLFEGACGEDHISRHIQFTSWRPRPRAWLRALRQWPSRFDDSGRLNFHARLAPGFLARLPDEFRANVRGHGVRPVSRDSLIGGPITFAMPYSQTAVPGGNLRYALPYRARSLQRLAAGMPAIFTAHNGMDRAFAREMLRGRVPDAVRLRPTSHHAQAPEHLTRLQRQAVTLPQRIADFRAEGVGDIVDLDWLADAGARIAARGTRSWDEAHGVQLTAMLASFLVKWRRGT